MRKRFAPVRCYASNKILRDLVQHTERWAGAWLSWNQIRCGTTVRLTPDIKAKRVWLNRRCKPEVPCRARESFWAI
ncbi:hypothetical protein F183_A12410 [Bryobacterales bacterium F-183]|nr:hypothetical protein F183_A12410 [Bryobacterales bacterium F-183]